ncbi:hypothetical protein AAFF_G00005570 [Aldrovandia affinis]|uniref:Uncharacterized protein n=1 Tax=Aldrovandia affinis TaxID=143900 RepID=A0AAD7TFM8_9TELE|nr:hypothetical protein AAFF_G00005570 [Aldrovandia affinis]
MRQDQLQESVRFSAGMDNMTIKVLQGGGGVQLKEEPPPKPVKLRRADVLSSKKKKVSEGPPSPRQGSKKSSKEASRPAGSNNENPWEWITLNRCLFMAVIIIVVSTGVNNVNEALEAFWEVEDGEELPEELALRQNGVEQGSTPEQTESFMWDNLFWWSAGPQQDDDENDDGAPGGKSRKRQARRRVARGELGEDEHGEDEEEEEKVERPRRKRQRVDL